MKDKITITKNEFVDATAEAVLKYKNELADNPQSNEIDIINVFGAIAALIYIELFSENENDDDSGKVFTD